MATVSSRARWNIPGLSKDKIFEEVDRFYRAYYLRPKPILRIIKTMLEDKDVLVRRCREGYEFFKAWPSGSRIWRRRGRRRNPRSAEASAARHRFGWGWSIAHESAVAAALWRRTPKGQPQPPVFRFI